MNCSQFIADSLAVRTAAHMAHLTTRSYSHHKALESFYAGLVPLIDRYAEAHMGEHNIASFPAARVPATTDAEQMLKDYIVVVRDKQADETEHKTKETILTEIEELALTTLYRMKLK